MNIPSFEEIFSLKSLFKSFKEFERGKKFKPDVAEFKSRLVENLMSLNSDIMFGNYKHGGYFHFKVSDPKPRDIHKASVRDRVVHHAIYRALYPYFDSKFIFWIKREIKVSKYIRYADDFVVLSKNREELEFLLLEAQDFLKKELRFEI